VQVRPDAIVNLAGPLDPFDWGGDVAFRFPQSVGGVARLVGSSDADALVPLSYADASDPPQTLVFSVNDQVVPWWTQVDDAAELLAVVDGELHVVEGGHDLLDAPVYWIDNWLKETS
jgi:hypothetical protein